MAWVALTPVAVATVVCRGAYTSAAIYHHKYINNNGDVKPSSQIVVRQDSGVQPDTAQSHAGENVLAARLALLGQVAVAPLPGQVVIY